MNPGKIIILVFVLFASLMLYFFISSRVWGTESVPNQYYEKGNAFQKELDARKRAEEEHYQPVIALEKTGYLTVTFPDSLIPDSVRIEAGKETEPNVKLTQFNQNKSIFRSSVNINSKGHWIVNCDYFRKGKAYQFNHKVFVE